MSPPRPRARASVVGMPTDTRALISLTRGLVARYAGATERLKLTHAPFAHEMQVHVLHALFLLRRSGVGTFGHVTRPPLAGVQAEAHTQ